MRELSLGAREILPATRAPRELHATAERLLAPRVAAVQPQCETGRAATEVVDEPGAGEEPFDVVVATQVRQVTRAERDARLVARHHSGRTVLVEVASIRERVQLAHRELPITETRQRGEVATADHTAVRVFFRIGCNLQRALIVRLYVDEPRDRAEQNPL